MLSPRRKATPPTTIKAVGFEDIMEVQQVFVDVDESNLENSLDVLANSKLLAEEAGRKTFIDELFRVLTIRCSGTEVLVKVVGEIASSFEGFMDLIVKKGLEIRNDWNLNEKVASYNFLRKLFLRGFFDLEKIAEAIRDWPDRSQLQFLMLFYYFVPELSEKYGLIVNEAKLRIRRERDEILKQPSRNVESLQFVKLAEKLREFEANDYELLKDYINNGSPRESIKKALRDDDEILLDSIVRRDRIDLNKRLEDNEFEPFLFVQWDPKPAEYAAFFGSFNCFRYIIGKVESIQYLTQLATAGGNEKILELLASRGAIFEGCPRIAAFFRRLDLFEWIMTMQVDGLNLKQELNYALCRACAINYIDMIVQIIDINANINFKDENGQTPLMVAAANNCAETVQYLLRYPNINLDIRDQYGYRADQLTNDSKIKDTIQEALERATHN